VFFRQVLHPDLGCASYVVADTDEGIGAVVDPKWDIAEYLDLAQHHSFRIAHVVETHNHADHLSGRGRLVQATGARVWIHRLADAGYDHEPFEDGAEIELGAVRLRVLHTPGHRPEHSAIVVIDGSRSDEACAVLCGDSLFVNDVARPDLAVEKREGAGELFESLQRLAALGDSVEVYPGHTGGSLCGSARMSEKTSSTIGYERANNPLLRLQSKAGFVEALIAGLPPQPPNFKKIAERNRTTMPTRVDRPVALSAERFAEALDRGAIVVDGRVPDEYDGAHIAGSIGVTVSSSGFGTKVAWLLGEGRELLLVGHDDAEALEMAELLGAVGAPCAKGMLGGGFGAWRTAGLPIESIGITDVAGLAQLREEDPGLQVLDVRGDDEWAEQRIPGSAHVQYHDLVERMPDLDRSRPVAVICSSGKRSAMAVGLLQRRGFADVIHITPGGVGTWARLGHAVESDEQGVPA
jgi:glyoxylase-like metal-dependent hydrolase (beta-lactamase superfamily II)/rhodanese-related sulfurtransferase